MQDKQDSKKHFPKAAVPAPVSRFLPWVPALILWWAGMEVQATEPPPPHAIETLTETLEIKHYTMSE